ncbi:hypothetical protein Btru_072858 [Bulinus truncatus]|nr:hypothetical protein Btru_072858 [Bulinus truncatus]
MVSSNKTCNNWGVTITKTELSHIKVLQKPLPKKPAQLYDQNSDKTKAVVNLLQTVVSSLIPGDSPLQKKQMALTLMI